MKSAKIFISAVFLFLVFGFNQVIAKQVVLEYSTYLGGSGTEIGVIAAGISVGTDGRAYIVGCTYSSNFPTANPYQAGIDGSADVFVTALTSTGSSLYYSTYLGGSDNDKGRGISVGTAGKAYVVGETSSSDFPTENSYQAAHGGENRDVFVSVLSSSGSTLYYSTYLGGSGNDEGKGISIGTGGKAYVTGSTESYLFPTKNPYQAVYVGVNGDAFVTALSSTGSSLYYSTYLGGDQPDGGRGIDLGTDGRAYIVGWTYSTNFPTKNPYQAGCSDFIGEMYGDYFVTALSSTGSSLYYSTYLGGTGDEASGAGISLGENGKVYITGGTSSSDYPTENPYQAGYGGYDDAVVTAFSSTGSTLLYSTYLGGGGSDHGNGISVGTDGRAYVTGYCGSSSFPTKNPYQAGNGGGSQDAFVTALSSTGSALYYSTYLGGSGTEWGQGIDLSTDGTTYITGWTRSSDFPTENPYQAGYGGDDDAFVSRLAFVATPPTPSPTPSVTPSTTPSMTPTPSVTPSTTPSMTPTPSVTPSTTPSMTPTPSVTPSITPTPIPCVPPFLVKNLEYITIQTPRASSGLGWYIRALGWNNDFNFGYVADNSNSWTDGGSVASSIHLKLKIDRNAEDIDIHEGDTLQIGYDTYYYLDVILPEVTVDGTELYVGLNGNTYTDLSLCSIAKGSPTPSPVPTKSAIPTPSVTPSVTPTPSMIPTPSVSPTLSSKPTPTPTMTPAGIAAPPWIYDYNGDGTSDIAIFRGGSGLWAVRGVTRVYFGSSADETVPGDYDGDGTTEIGIFRGTSGLWAIRSTTRAYFGSGSDLPEPGDYDGDGTADIGIFRYNSGLWAIRGVTRVYFGGAADLPASGYYDGDSTKDIGIFRGSSGLWAIRNVTRVYFGSSSDTIVPGDYDGNGTWGIGIFRGTSGLWAIRNVTRSYFGSGVDQPIPGDYKGDGKDNIGIFRSTSGLWAVQGVTRTYFGGSSDTPVTR